MIILKIVEGGKEGQFRLIILKIGKAGARTIRHNSQEASTWFSLIRATGHSSIKT